MTRVIEPQPVTLRRQPRRLLLQLQRPRPPLGSVLLFQPCLECIPVPFFEQLVSPAFLFQFALDLGPPACPACPRPRAGLGLLDAASFVPRRDVGDPNPMAGVAGSDMRLLPGLL